MTARTALLVIDAQVNMFDPAFPAHDAPVLLARLADLVTRAHAAGVPVVLVRNNGGPQDPDAPGSPGWALHPALGAGADDVVLDKTTPDTFASTALADTLQARGVSHVVVSGLQSDFCVRATTQGAIERGYAVTLVSDGHGTFDGGGLTAGQISAAVNAEFADCVRLVTASEVRFD